METEKGNTEGIKARLRAAEQQLYRQEIMLNELANSTRTGFMIVDERTEELLYYSERLLEILGIRENWVKEKIRYHELLDCLAKFLQNREFFDRLFLSPIDNQQGIISADIELPDGKTLKIDAKIIKDKNLGYLGRITVFDDIIKDEKISGEQSDSLTDHNYGIDIVSLTDKLKDIQRSVKGYITIIRKGIDSSDRIDGWFGRLREELDKFADLLQTIQMSFQKRSNLIEIKEKKGVSMNDVKTILLVEDEEDVLDCLSDFLEMEGYQVISALDADEGIKKYRAHAGSISLVFTDLDLSGEKNGEDLITEIKSLNPKQKCILASGLLEEEIKKGKPDDRFIIYLQKPYNFDLMVEMVNEFINSE